MQKKGSDIIVVRAVNSENRNFIIKYLSFRNGCFIAVSEDLDAIGSISISISSSNKVNTAKVIPSKYDPVFVNTISERVSSMINGICIVSFHNKKQLHLVDMKAIMGEVLNIIREEHNETDYRE
jgi:hypothetical protein